MTESLEYLPQLELDLPPALVELGRTLSATDGLTGPIVSRQRERGVIKAELDMTNQLLALDTAKAVTDERPFTPHWQRGQINSSTESWLEKAL